MFTLLAFALLAQSPQITVNLPKFEDFAVQETFRGKAALPILSTPGQRRYRTMIRNGAKKGPNFAGHFTVSTWGCGLACIAVAVIDSKTGIIYKDPFDKKGPFNIVIFGQDLKYDQDDFIDSESAALTYQLNSRLLIVRGCTGFKIQNCAAYFYEWTGRRFKLLHEIPATRDSR